MSWFRKRDESEMSDDEVLEVYLSSARVSDYESRLWNREHSPTSESGNWSQEAWRNNAHLIRAADEARAEGAESYGDNPNDVIDQWKNDPSRFWWWKKKYD